MQQKLKDITQRKRYDTFVSMMSQSLLLGLRDVSGRLGLSTRSKDLNVASLHLDGVIGRELRVNLFPPMIKSR